MNLKSRRRSVLLIALCLVLALAMLSSCTKDAYVPAGMKRITNRDIVDYTMYVPVEWTEDISTGVVTAYYSSTDRSNISMMAFDLEDTASTLDDYWALYQQQFADTFSDMSMMTDGDTMLIDGKPAQKYIYQASVTGTTYQFMQVLILSVATVYVFTYTSTPEVFDTHIEAIDNILEHIEF